MGRPSHTKNIAIWMNGVRVGVWSYSAYKEAQFTYDDAWFAHPSFRSISLSLPAIASHPIIRGAHVNHYFDNLLPDSEHIRRRLQSKFQTDDISAFSLLSAVGRDCVGAIQLLPMDEVPVNLEVTEAQTLSELEVERTILRSLTASSNLMAEDEHDLRLSIAGAQEKTALLRHKNAWCLPIGSTPTTHIFKLPLGLVGNRQADMSTSVENEWLCSRILNAYTLPVAPTEITTFGKTKVLVVERFDRKLAQTGSYYVRLPQEDFCQATGTPFSHKYENDGGPGMEVITAILRNSINAKQDIYNFFKTQLVFWMLRACDGHAKNFSIFLLPQSRFQLTPMYDVLSAWPIIGVGPNLIATQKVKMAMAWLGKNKHYVADTIQQRHFIKTMQKGGLAFAPEELITELITMTPQVINQANAELPRGFPQQLVDSIFKGLHSSAKQLDAFKM